MNGHELKKVWATSWFHDGSAPGPAKTGYGNNWVVAAVIVRLPALSRPVAIPVLAKLVIKGTSSASRLWLARRMAAAIAAALPGRRIHVAADSADAGGELKKLPSRVTVVLIRDRAKASYDLALVTTDAAASAAAVIERYARRWSVEVAIEDSKQIFDAGQARNRTARAVERAIRSS